MESSAAQSRLAVLSKQLLPVSIGFELLAGRPTALRKVVAQLLMRDVPPRCSSLPQVSQDAGRLTMQVKLRKLHVAFSETA